MNKTIIIVLILMITFPVFGMQHRLDADGKAVSNVLLATAAGSIVLILFPGWMLDDELSDRYGYQDYPFAEEDGYKKTQGKDWDFYLSLGDSPDNDLQFGLETSWKRFVMETRYRMFTLDDADLSGSEVQIMPSFIFAHNEYLDFRICAGYSLYGEDAEGSSVDTAYKIRYFKKPFFCTLGAENRFYFHDDEDDQFQLVTVSVGYVWKRFEVNLEYEYRFAFDEVRHTARFGAGLWL